MNLLVEDNELECKENAIATTLSFEKRGLVIHPQKSGLQPSKSTSFLGFIPNSIDMSVRLLENKSRRYSGECRRLIQKIRENIRTVASLIGKTSSWQYDPV